MTMLQFEDFVGLFLLLLVFPTVQTHTCPHSDDDDNYINRQYLVLYQKFEEALINNSQLLGDLRAGFITGEYDEVSFFLAVELKDISDPHDYGHENAAFCRSSGHQWWTLCVKPVLIEFSSETQLKKEKENVDNIIIWLSLLHGSLNLLVPSFYSKALDMGFGFGYTGNESYTLSIDHLNFNPSISETKCILLELFSWIKVYAEVGGKPQTWDESLKGTITFYEWGDDDWDEYNNGKNIMKFMTWPIDANPFVVISLLEYVFVSTSLALVIAKFFPAVHNQIVSRATRLEHQSLYWGTAVISNTFIYGLLFGTARGFCIYLAIANNIEFDISNSIRVILTTVLPIQEIVINVVLFVGAVVATLSRENSIITPIPPGIAEDITNLSFCWSCFCCCVCCSPRCRAKTMTVLVLFSFMVFIYNTVMGTVSIVFALFIEDSRASVLTYSLLYTLIIVFLVFFISFLFYSLSHDRNNDASTCECFGGICMLTTVFPAVMLMIVMYMIIVFSLDLKGVSGIVTGLIPTIVLSAASWYLKKRLGKRLGFSGAPRVRQSI